MGDVTRIVHKCLDALIGALIGHDDNDARRIIEDQIARFYAPQSSENNAVDLLAFSFITDAKDLCTRRSFALLTKAFGF